MRGWRRLVTAGLVLGVALSMAATSAVAATTLADPVAEAKNLLVSQERTTQFSSPFFLLQMFQATAAYQAQRMAIDPGRQPNPNPCTTILLCPIDPRLTNWISQGGIVAPVLYTARNGATLSGHVWATAAGPAKRPAVLIINGSIVGYEQVYWYAAQALARAGFVVMTFDVQGEGMSDQFGEAPDQQEGAGAGTPVISATLPNLGGSGLPFYDGGEDSLNFFFSTPTRHYVPVPSRGSTTSHAAKQDRRVLAGLDSSYNPLWQMVDPDNVGVAGHSYGAEATSWLVQSDPRLKAAVSWDTLCQPTAAGLDEATTTLAAPVNQGGAFGLPPQCFGAPDGPVPPITKPALGLSADYILLPQPHVVAPDPYAKDQASIAYSNAGVDTGQINIRGGTHFDFTDVTAGVPPASNRGIDMVTWYTVAWFDKHLKHDPNADAMLLTNRWQHDAQGGAVDPSGDPNLQSYYYFSRLDIHSAGGSHFTCTNLRAGCSGQTTSATDCGAAIYSMVGVDTGAVPWRTCPVAP